MYTALLSAPLQFDVVRVVCIRGNRFENKKVFYQRHPKVGDVGAVLEVYATPTLAYEVECSDPTTGITIWLEAMYAEEIELVLSAKE